LQRCFCNGCLATGGFAELDSGLLWVWQCAHSGIYIDIIEGIDGIECIGVKTGPSLWLSRKPRLDLMKMSLLQWLWVAFRSKQFIVSCLFGSSVAIFFHRVGRREMPLVVWVAADAGPLLHCVTVTPCLNLFHFKTYCLEESGSAFPELLRHHPVVVTAIDEVKRQIWMQGWCAALKELQEGRLFLLYALLISSTTWLGPICKKIYLEMQVTWHRRVVVHFVANHSAAWLEQPPQSLKVKRWLCRSLQRSLGGSQ